MSSPRRILFRVVALLAAAAMVAAACGSSDGDTETSADDSAEQATEEPADGDEAEPAEGDDAEPAEGDEAEPADGDEAEAEEEVAAGPPPETDGFDGETITLGYLTDQSGTLAIVGNSLLAGSQAYWDWVNTEEGGIAGMYQVELEVGDTQDQEATTVTEYQRIKDDVVLFAQVLSTPPVQALLEFLEEDGVVAVPGSLAGQWTNEALLLPNGTPYELEMINLADWYLNQSGLATAEDTICVIAFNDKYGTDTRRGVEFASEQLGFEIAEVQTVARGGASFTAEITALAEAGCTVVFAITVAFETNAILAEANAQGFEPIWLGALPSYVNLLALGNQDLYADYHVALDTPNLSDTSVKGMADFLDRWDGYGGGTPNTFNLSGYFQSIAIRALLEEAVARGDLGREGIQDALANLGEVELDGLADNYVYGTPENRVPARASRIFVFDPDAPPNLLTELAQIESDLAAEFQF